MGLFMAAQGWDKGLLPQNQSNQISYNDKTWDNYALAKEDPKIYKARDKLEIRKSSTLVILGSTDIDSILGYTF